MATLAEMQAMRTALEKARFSGNRRVKTGNTEIEFKTDAEMAAALDELEARRIVVSNAIVYARVIERGMHGRVPWSKQPQVPREGVYKAAVRQLRRRFGTVATIEFTFVDNEDGERQPAITVEAR